MKPVDALPVIDDMLRRVDAGELPDPPVWWVDQATAAQRDHERQMRTLVAQQKDTFYREVKPSRESLAFVMAATDAIVRRARYTCGHVLGEPSLGRQYAADLTTGTWTCMACFEDTVMLATIDGLPDDGLCDVCGERSSIFVPMNMTTGMLLLSANICEECARWSGCRHE